MTGTDDDIGDLVADRGAAALRHAKATIGRTLASFRCQPCGKREVATVVATAGGALYRAHRPVEPELRASMVAHKRDRRVTSTYNVDVLIGGPPSADNGIEAWCPIHGQLQAPSPAVLAQAATARRKVVAPLDFMSGDR